jgi:uncharacterized protein
MLINVSTIPEGRSVLSQLVKIEGEQAQWLVCKEDLNCRAEIDRIVARITIHLYYKGVVELECSRCLAHFDYPIMGDFHVLLTNRSVEKKRDVSPEDDVDFYFSDGTEEIDIGSAIFDDIITTLPMKPVCRENCPGIAGVVKDIEVSEESPVKSDQIDSRWDVLKKFKNK